MDGLQVALPPLLLEGLDALLALLLILLVAFLPLLVDVLLHLGLLPSLGPLLVDPLPPGLCLQLLQPPLLLQVGDELLPRLFRLEGNVGCPLLLQLLRLLPQADALAVRQAVLVLGLRRAGGPLGLVDFIARRGLADEREALHAAEAINGEVEPVHDPIVTALLRGRVDKLRVDLEERIEVRVAVGDVVCLRALQLIGRELDARSLRVVPHADDVVLVVQLLPPLEDELAGLLLLLACAGDRRHHRPSTARTLLSRGGPDD
mmetsp:Transcript_7496/g.21369  ORF Transcript_7496/g.21369 Transcript_7496/m.21369 type:complete len:261 (-) Transcript_7496:49-831(-)